MRLGFMLLWACVPRAAPSSIVDAPPAAPADVVTETTPQLGLGALTVRISSPEDGAIVAAEHMTVSGTADGRAEQVFVRVGPNAPLRASTDDGFRTWRVDTPLGPGTHKVVANAGDVVSDALHVTRPSAAADDAPPSLTILGPIDAPKYQPTLISGTAGDDRAVTRIDVSVDGVAYGTADTSDFYAHWFASLELSPGATHTIVITAWDAAGHSATQTLVLALPSVQDRTPPEVAVLAPGDTVDADTVTVSGTAYDAGGIAVVKVLLNGATYLATYDAVSGQFSAQVPLPFGEVTFDVKAIDSAGLVTTVSHTVTNTRVREWSEETLYTLRDREDDPRPALSLSLNEIALKQLIDLPTRKQVKVLDINPTALLENALLEIMNACGTGWQADTSSPVYNCNLTPLGQSFPQPWQNSAEYSLVRLLTMTPANVDVEGTSIETLADIADLIGLGGGFGQLLALTLGISRTTPVVPRQEVAQALRDNWMGSHPAMNADRTMPITLHDVLEDMAPLAETFGPAGAHPGIVAAPPYAALFGPATAINLRGTSNLRWMDGVQLGVGKEYYARIDRPKLIDLDFDNGFSIVNMVSNAPTIDLKFRVVEDAARIAACTSNACQDNVPGANPRGIWWVLPWKLESVINLAAYLRYHTRDPNPDRVYDWDILISWASITVQNTPWAKAWVVIVAKFAGINLGAPPPQYLWELIDEVAQRRLHYPIGGSPIAEGNANVAFTLKQVPTGLTAATIVNGVREQLRLQEAFLIDRMLGNWQSNNGPVDFYYRDGKLIFLSGFEHVLTPGDEELLVQGQDGATYRLRIHVPSGPRPSIELRVAKHL